MVSVVAEEKTDPAVNEHLIAHSLLTSNEKPFFHNGKQSLINKEGISTNIEPL